MRSTIRENFKNLSFYYDNSIKKKKKKKKKLGCGFWRKLHCSFCPHGSRVPLMFFVDISTCFVLLNLMVVSLFSRLNSSEVTIFLEKIIHECCYFFVNIILIIIIEFKFNSVFYTESNGDLFFSICFWYF